MVVGRGVLDDLHRSHFFIVLINQKKRGGAFENIQDEKHSGRPDWTGRTAYSQSDSDQKTYGDSEDLLIN